MIIPEMLEGAHVRYSQQGVRGRGQSDMKNRRELYTFWQRVNWVPQCYGGCDWPSRRDHVMRWSSPRPPGPPLHPTCRRCRCSLHPSSGPTGTLHPGVLKKQKKTPPPVSMAPLLPRRHRCGLEASPTVGVTAAQQCPVRVTSARVLLMGTRLGGPRSSMWCR